ncbi:cryptochrome/photolyase family protein [Legionella bononiensis]|uniref:Deoxyribodipyrimidine photo-lyase n=1 Tax=Legionella bononiensis TaxID=2793102 RepID=A0ABS1WAP9_9GAMM|nr:deoxyribodipyrimidine photo-lyase [Legionella bononiensis]MBL7480360.1 deoxyribodipyrimidine photo-lyase [Legionella bononiensis]MBL7526408.1 deoxyribodipyrimidine photo-lyase [Legionella bononiensis]MBL7563098.1 deoxyribodipyrimidine photo-lyase [Legionella bononiensis]
MSTALVWFRQDLRLADNPAFFEACTNNETVIPIYILDEKSSVLGEAQAWWLHHSLKTLNNALVTQHGINLILRKGTPLEIISDLVNTVGINSIYWNRCYEPKSIERDKKIKATFQEHGIDVFSFNGSLLNEPWTISNKTGDFFKVFTPYWKTCRQALTPQPEQLISHNHTIGSVDVRSDEIDEWRLLPRLDWASQFPDFWTPGEQGAQRRLHEFITHHLNGYKINRDIPEKQATSHLSPHLHFGEISPWTILRAVEYAKLNPHCDLAGAEHFLSELGWREFSYYLLYHVPSLPYDNFKKEFDAFPWHNDESLLKCWQKGMTGYPIVDAGMRELWATGYMHNRVRMIVASFLTKGLFIDWRLGADWFLDTLVDADLANNSASWQWVAGCGADAAPYFRIFNPVLQSQKFDPNGVYIRRWIPELLALNNDIIHAPWESSNAAGIYSRINYPKPIINHSESRSKALEYYSQLKKSNTP